MIMRDTEEDTLEIKAGTRIIRREGIKEKTVRITRKNMLGNKGKRK